MYLTPLQEKILKGEYGWIVAKALEIIVKVGETLGADKLIPVKHVHVSGVSYINIGEYGLEFIREFYVKGGSAIVYTTINPCCIDLTSSSRVISNEYFMKQIELNNYLEKMSFKPTYTCIPYLHRRPITNEHLAWGESSAVILANSVYGARTNREGGLLTIASAITGYTYNYGLHLDSERVVSTIVSINNIDSKYCGLIGLWIGENISDKPMIRSIEFNYSELKILLAAAAAAGDHDLIVVENYTPERTYMVSEKVERISIDLKDIDEYIETEPEPDSRILGYIGCPHLDPREFLYLYRYVVHKCSTHGCRFKGDLLLTLPFIYSKLFRDEIETLRKIGVDVALGTCPVVSKLSREYDYVLTNSGKAYFYLKKHKGLKPRIYSLTEIVDYVCGFN